MIEDEIYTDRKPSKLTEILAFIAAASFGFVLGALISLLLNQWNSY